MIVSITGKGRGTGFFVRENLIATNIHCIAGATSVSVKPLDSDTDYGVEGVVAFNHKNDLVILKISGIGTPFLIDNSDILKKGEIVQAIGCIDGKCVTVEGEYHSSVNNEQWLQTTAKTVDGYSGGPLLNSKGLVIGVNFGSGDYYSEAITSDTLKGLLSKVNEIETLTQWQNRKQIKAYDYLVKSKGKIKTKHYTDAIDDLDETIRQNPDYIIAHINRGEAKKHLAQSEYEADNIIHAQQLYQAAVDDFTTAIKLCPDFVVAYNNRGVCRSLIGQLSKNNSIQAQKHLKSAIDDLTQAIKLCPDLSLVYNNRADAKLHFAKVEADAGNRKISQGLYNDAMSDINIAIKEHANKPIEEDSNIALCYHTRGEIKEAIGNLTGSKYDLEKAKKNIEYANESKVSADLKRVNDKLKQQE